MDLRRPLLAALLALSAGCTDAPVLPVACVSADETMCAALLTVPDGIAAQLACEWALGPDPIYLAENPYAFPLSRYPATDVHGSTLRVYTDLAVEYTGYVYLFSYAVGTPSAQQLDIYDPNGNWVCRTPDVPGAKFTVSLWRDLYAGNYETLHNPVTGVYEPSISHWIPSTP